MEIKTPISSPPLPVSQTPPTNTFPLSNRKLSPTPLIVLIAVILLGGAAFGAYQLGKIQVTLPKSGSTAIKELPVTEQPKTSTVSSSVLSPVLSPVPDPTAGWKTYTSFRDHGNSG